LLARIAFWSYPERMSISWPLVCGLAIMLSLGLLSWAKEHDRTIADLGGYAGMLVLFVIIQMAFNFRRKAKEI